MGKYELIEIGELDDDEDSGADKAPKRKPKRRYAPKTRRGVKISKVVLLLLLTAAAAGITSYLLAYREVENEFARKRQPIVIEEGEALKTLRDNLEGGSSVMTALRKSFRDYLIIHDGDRYIFMPIDFSREMHDRKPENIRKISDTEWEYREHGRKVSYKGIDVSSHQDAVDWEKVAADGVEFAMIRACYRGYGEAGNLKTDDRFEENIRGASAAGLHTGVYMFSQALNSREMEEEIELLLGAIRPYPVDCPVVLDIELTQDRTGRADGLTMEERTALAKQFCEAVKAAGYRPMLYYNFESALLLLDTQQLEEYDVWYANYTSDFYYPYYYALWQYTDSGRVNGISGNVDMDISFEKFWE